MVRTARRSRAVLSRPHRAALLAAVAVMAVGGAAGTALPLLSGMLVDRVATGLPAGESQHVILRSLGYVLGAIAGLVLLREPLSVLRRQVGGDEIGPHPGGRDRGVGRVELVAQPGRPRARMAPTISHVSCGPTAGRGPTPDGKTSGTTGRADAMMAWPVASGRGSCGTPSSRMGRHS